MPNARAAHAVRLEFAPGSLVHANLSGASFTGDWLWVAGDDLFILAGPTMVLNGDIRVFKWPGARQPLAANREPVRFESALTESVTLPHGRGTNRAEGGR
jgi:Protein of unknown function (DUF3616)